MKSYLRFFAVFIIAVISMHSNAGNLAGAIGITQVHGSVDDPDGSTDASTESVLSLILTYNLANQWRLWTDISSYELELDYGVNNIGQKAETLQIDTIVQRAHAFDTFTFGWLGIGVGVGFSEYSNRAKTLNTGFIDPNSRFDDRDETNLHGILNAGIVRGLNQKFSVGANAKYAMSFNEGIEGLSLTGYISYQF